MSDLFWLTEVQMARLAPFSLKPHGEPQVDDKRVLSGMIFINRNGFCVGGMRQRSAVRNGVVGVLSR